MDKVTGPTADLYRKLRAMIEPPNRRPPSNEELKDAMGYASKSTVTYHLKILSDLGMIERLPGARNIVLRENLDGSPYSPGGDEGA